jgi:Zn-dependent M28 family amino/carboxypeptidase
MTTAPSSAPPAPPTPAPTAPARRRRVRFATLAALKRLAILFLIIALFLLYAYYAMLVMPGRSFRGELPPATKAQQELAAELRASITVLADATGGVGRVGNRSTFYPKRFAASAAWIHDQLTSYGYTTIRETPVARGSPVPSMEVTVPGTTKSTEIVVIGAHYDAFQGTPGADDNASGVAACLYLARVFQKQPQARTLRFLFFVNEEPPAFWTEDMGSWVYAKKCRAADDNIVAMLSLESIGYYSTAPGSQKYPPPLNAAYPDRGDFIAFVSDYSSRALNKRAIASFRRHAQFPSEGGSPPGVLPGVGWSDHWSFSKEGYRAIMLTDTATFRNPNYHTPADRVDTLDYDRMSRVVGGVEEIVKDLASDRDR